MRKGEFEKTEVAEKDYFLKLEYGLDVSDTAKLFMTGLLPNVLLEKVMVGNGRSSTKCTS